MSNNAVFKHFSVIWKGNICLSTRKHLITQSDVGMYAQARWGERPITEDFRFFCKLMSVHL